jgi:hypothetical protein
VSYFGVRRTSGTSARFVVERLVDRLELGLGDPAGRERLRIDPAGQNLAIEDLTCVVLIVAWRMTPADRSRPS